MSFSNLHHPNYLFKLSDLDFFSCDKYHKMAEDGSLLNSPFTLLEMDSSSLDQLMNQFHGMNDTTINEDSQMGFSIDSFFLSHQPNEYHLLEPELVCDFPPVGEMMMEKKKKRKRKVEIGSLDSNFGSLYSVAFEVKAPKKDCSEKERRRKLKEEKEVGKPMEVVHVRARRGQATDSHSLAERARREKIKEKMRRLQDLVPGCYKAMGMTVMLDEIINYVKSLQNQVEFLSMKLSAAISFPGINLEDLEPLDIHPKIQLIEESFVYPQL